MQCEQHVCNWNCNIHISLLDDCIGNAICGIFGISHRTSTWDLRECVGIHSIRKLIDSSRERFIGD